MNLGAVEIMNIYGETRIEGIMYIYGEMRTEGDMRVCAFHLWRRPEHPEETF